MRQSASRGDSEPKPNRSTETEKRGQEAKARIAVEPCGEEGECVERAHEAGRHGLVQQLPHGARVVREAQVRHQRRREREATRGGSPASCGCSCGCHGPAAVGFASLRGRFRAFGSGARAEVRSEKDGGGWPLINTNGNGNGNGKKSSMSSKTNGTVYFAFYFTL
jgi:hypothetical protein